MSGKDDSPGFQAAWFLKQFESGREGPTLDFKRQPYKFSGDEAKFEFARDIIAFANVAWRTGQPCRILFGIRVDEGRRSLRNVRDEYPGERPPKWWHNPDASIHEKQVDGVEKVLHEIAAQWVEPDVADLFHLEYGEVEGKFVSYLEIKPVQTPEAFRLRQPIIRRNRAYRVGDVFVRCGASTELVAPSQVSFLRPLSQAAYLDQRQWKEVIRAHIGGDFEVMQSLVPSFQPRAKGQDITAFDAVLQALDEKRRLIVIEGNAGEGKTVLIHRIAFALAQRHNLDQPTRREHFGQEDLNTNDETVNSVAQELEVVPAQPVPIFMALRAAFETTNDFAEQLLGHVRAWTRNPGLKALEALFEIPGSQWVILLDGVDEIRNRHEFAPCLRAWLQCLPSNVQTVLTARPPYVSFDIPGTVRVCLEPLTRDEVLYLLMGKLPGEDEIRSEVERWMLQQPDLLSMLARPRALDGLVRTIVPDPAVMPVPIDRDRVEITERQTMLPSRGKGELPIVTVHPFSESVDADSPEQEVEEGGWIPPQLALAIQSITEYMRAQEVKRRYDWGINAQQLAEQAQYALDTIAWRTDWETDIFDPMDCERQGWTSWDALEWNEDVGFIQHETFRKYRFLCSLFHQYAIAEHGYYMSNEQQLESDLRQRELDRPSARAVIRLLNELRAANGQPILTLTKEGG